MIWARSIAISPGVDTMDIVKGTSSLVWIDMLRYAASADIDTIVP